MDPLQTESKIWDYIDGTCSDADKATVQALLQTAPEWKKKYDELLQLHQLINATDLEEPSMRFTQNVMEEIAKFQIAPATRSYINNKIIYGIGGFFIVMIAGLLIYSLGQINWSEQDSSFMRIDTSKIEWGKFFNTTYMRIFMMVNVLLGLMLLDKYLNRKKEQAKQKHS